MRMSDLAAIASQLLMNAEMDASEPSIPLPGYVTLSDTDFISFQMRTFHEVEIWADYMKAKYDYSEAVGKHWRSDQATEANFGFAFAQKKFTHMIGNTEVAYTLQVQHNELASPDPKQPTLDDM